MRSYRKTPFFLIIATGIIVLSSACFLIGKCGSLRAAPISSEDEPSSHDLQEPEYDRIDQFLLLSNQWVVVAINNMENVLKIIDEETDGQFMEFISAWEESKKTNYLKWYEKKEAEKLFSQHIVEARLKSGEMNLDTTKHYSITSSTDPDYKDPQEPELVTRFIVSLGGPRIPGEDQIHYDHYCYLNLPTPLKDENEYTISTKDGRSVTFFYDERKSVSRAIKINQIGYLPEAKEKYAYLGCYLHELGPMDCSHVKQFHVINDQTGEIAYSGDIKLRAENPRIAPKNNESANDKPLITGENTYELDFSGLKDEGNFFISIPGIGRSWTFRHAKDVYGKAFFIATRGMYHQRCGIEIGEPYSPWPRIKCHTDPVYESKAISFIPKVNPPRNYNNFDVIGYTTDLNRGNPKATGGWHDAADWDKSSMHYTNVFDMLNAFELAPYKFTDGQLNIPESGNGIPDILDEVEYGLKVWRKSIDERGGVTGMVETSTHPPIVSPSYPYAYSQRTRWNSFLYAAAAAQFARLVHPYNQELSEKYQDSATQAFIFGKNPENSLGQTEIPAATNRGKGERYTIEWEEKDEFVIPYETGATIQMYLLTEDDSLLEELAVLLDKSPLPYNWNFSVKDFSPWLFYSITTEKFANKLPRKVIDNYRNHFIQYANDLEKHVQSQPYRFTFPLNQDFWMSWGASDFTNHARALWIAYQLTQDEKYKTAAILNTDYMLGGNPMGMSWTTSLGQVYPIDIQHAVSEDDGIPDPVPGITLYGITEGYFRTLKEKVWQSKKPDGEVVKFMTDENWNVPVWRKWACHPSLNTPQCEFTIHETMSSTIFMTAMLMSEDWKPSDKILNHQPRPEKQLHGYWYLP